MECSHEHAVRAVIDLKRKEHKDWISTVPIDIPSTCRSLLELASAFALKKRAGWSSGHPKYRRLTPDEAIGQAFSLHECVRAEILKRGLAIEIPRRTK